ncbi:MAG: hypothetical protein U0230_27065 [Polyangiales bacterium]
MKRFLVALRALAVVLACWGVLGLVGYLAHVLPPRGAAPTPRVPAPDASVAASPDAPRAVPDAGSPIAVDRPDASEEAAPTNAAEVLSRRPGCTGAVEPTIATLALRAGERPLLFLGCGAEAEILGFVALASGGDQPLRVATVRAPLGPTEPPVRRMRAIAADLTGDGVIDWAFGTLRAAAAGAPQSGTLHLAAGDGRGSFASPALLGPVAVADLAAATLDGDVALDLVALHQPDGAGRRRSEAWVYTGGSSPVRTARLQTVATATGLALLALDADEPLDVVVGGAGEPSATAHLGDGSARFPRTAPIVAPSLTAVTRGDLDGDGWDDLVLVGGGVRWVKGKNDGLSFEAVELPGVPELRQPTLVDVTGDGTVDLVGIGPAGELLVARRTEPGRFAVEPLLALPAEAGRIVGFVAADLVGGPAVDLVLLLERDASTHTREWVLVEDVVAPRSPTVGKSPASVPTAPVALALELRGT